MADWEGSGLENDPRYKDMEYSFAHVNRDKIADKIEAGQYGLNFDSLLDLHNQIYSIMLESIKTEQNFSPKRKKIIK